jgi:hypothetical protein
VDALFDDAFGALLLHVPFDALDLLGRDGAHVIADVASPDGLEQGHQRLVLETQIPGDLVHAKLAHRTSTKA